jgi:hypothetical protein
VFSCGFGVDGLGVAGLESGFGLASLCEVGTILPPIHAINARQTTMTVVIPKMQRLRKYNPALRLLTLSLY